MNGLDTNNGDFNDATKSEPLTRSPDVSTPGLLLHITLAFAAIFGSQYCFLPTVELFCIVP